MLGRNTLEIFCVKTRSKKLFKFIVANLEGAVPIFGAKFPAISPFFCFVRILKTCALYFFYIILSSFVFFIDGLACMQIGIIYH